MTKLFAETIATSISDYRQLLRRYLKQSERVTKLAALNLKDPNIYNSEIALYHTAWAIVRDIEKNMDIPEQGYYSYSGIQHFCNYLKEFLNNYEIESNYVVHRAQKASRAIIQAIQLSSTPQERLDMTVKERLEDCNRIVADYGSDEQYELHRSTLTRHQTHNPEFYQPLLESFETRVRKINRLNADESIAA